MSSVNKVLLLGNLGKDPEVRHTNSGTKVVSFSMATSERWTDKATGEKRENTYWHNIVIFNENLATVAEKYLKKGSKVYVEGALQTRKWQDQQGTDRWTTEVVLKAFNGQIVLLGGNQREAPTEESYGAGATTRPQSSATGGGRKIEDMNDDVPFSCEWR